jgi:hypothetical protein
MTSEEVDNLIKEMKKELVLRLQERVNDHQFLPTYKNWASDEADHRVNELRNEITHAVMSDLRWSMEDMDDEDEIE